MRTGAFCLSFDAELIWGRVGQKNIRDFIWQAEKEHIIVPQIIKILERYNVPATWAVVGHYFLDSCNGIHKEIAPPRSKMGWFQEDPGTNIKSSPAWYGLDILKKIRKSKSMEIASHTFSHFYWIDDNISKASALQDLKAWKTHAKKLGINSSSLVFPKNQACHLDSVEKLNFKTVRLNDKAWYTGFPKLVKTPLQAIDLFLPVHPTCSAVYKTGKLAVTHGSFYFPSNRGLKKYIPQGLRSKKAKLGIQKAIETGKVFHMWTHPIDFSINTESLLHEFEEIISFAAEKRNGGKLLTLTMKGLNNLYETL